MNRKQVLNDFNKLRFNYVNFNHMEFVWNTLCKLYIDKGKLSAKSFSKWKPPCTEKGFKTWKTRYSKEFLKD